MTIQRKATELLTTGRDRRYCHPCTRPLLHQRGVLHTSSPALQKKRKGCYGARAFVKALEKEQLASIKAMINIDSVGMTPPKVWVTRSDKRLVEMIARIGSSTKIPVTGVNVDKVGDSDSRPFADKKIPVLDIHSVTTETLPILHSDKDKLSAIVLQQYFDTFRLIAATLVLIDR